MQKSKAAQKTKGTSKKAVPTPRELIIDLLNRPEFTFEQLCNRLQYYPSKLENLLDELREFGVNITTVDNKLVIDKQEQMGPENKEFKHKLPSGVHRIALISDSHLGSHYQQLSYLKEFYQRASDLGVTNFYHSGDICAGDGKVYPGQINEIFSPGLDASVEYVKEVYPKLSGVNTYFITGNHDLSWFQRGGVDIGNAIQKARPDLKYLGQAGAYINLTTDTRLYLFHPAGGRAYALSYKVQKFIEGLTPEQRPQMLASGHLHTMLYMDYVGVDTFMVPCFEAQNTFLKRLGLHPCIGGWILELEIDGNHIMRIGMDSITFDNPILNDY